MSMQKQFLTLGISVRPFHFSCMLSECFVKELLAHGASPTATTLEGLSPLHLAARACQSNIVGILISHLSREGDPETLAAHVNAKDQIGRSPLHYACRSGRPETVALLLEAGGDPEVQDENGMGLLDACAEFEEEQRLWVDHRKPSGAELQLLYLYSYPTNFGGAAAGTKLHDTLRPYVEIGRKVTGYLGEDRPTTCIRSDQDTTRLEEILDMLFDISIKQEKGAEVLSAPLPRCIQRCEMLEYAYTLKNLKSLEARLAAIANPLSQSYVTGDEESESPEQQQQQDAIILQSVNNRAASRTKEYINLEVVEQLLRWREYGVIVRLLRRGSCSTTARAKKTGRILRFLVGHGFVHILRSLFSSDDPPTMAASDRIEPGDPLLLVCCQRKLPNMDMARLLLEEQHVDVNAANPSKDGIDRYEYDGLPEIEIETFPGQHTALHQLSLGFCWWHVELGIPFLLSHGANLERGNDENVYPLQMAQESIKVFAKEAAEVLTNALPPGSKALLTRFFPREETDG